MYLERRTVITLAIIILPIIVVGAFLIFNSRAHNAMENNLKAQVRDAKKSSSN